VHFPLLLSWEQNKAAWELASQAVVVVEMGESRTSPGGFWGLLGSACFGLSSGEALWSCLLLSDLVGLCEVVLRSLLALLEMVSGALLLHMAHAMRNELLSRNEGE
jgi:hypothetical protein